MVTFHKTHVPIIHDQPPTLKSIESSDIASNLFKNRPYYKYPHHAEEKKAAQESQELPNNLSKGFQCLGVRSI